MVERSLRMREARGSIPRVSIFLFVFYGTFFSFFYGTYFFLSFFNCDQVFRLSNIHWWVCHPNSCAHSVENFELVRFTSDFWKLKWHLTTYQTINPCRQRECAYDKFDCSSNGQEGYFGFEKDAESCNRLHISFSPWSTNRIKSGQFLLCLTLSSPRNRRGSLMVLERIQLWINSTSCFWSGYGRVQ